MNDTIVIALVSGIVALLVAGIPTTVSWFLARSQRRKTDADAADVLTGAALKIVKELQGQVDKLERHVTKLEKELEFQKGALKTMTELNVGLLRGTIILTEQLIGLGEEPCWAITGISVGDKNMAEEIQRIEGELS